MFQLKPYSETKLLKGSKEAPLIVDGEVFPKWGQRDIPFVMVFSNYNHTPYGVDSEDCHQLITEKPCNVCKGEGWITEAECCGHFTDPFGTCCMDPNPVQAQCNCHNGRPLEIYKGSKCESCDHLHKLNPEKDNCGYCNGSRIVDHTAEIVELLQVVELSLQKEMPTMTQARKAKEAQTRLSELTNQ